MSVPPATPAVAYRRVSTDRQARGGHSYDEDQPRILADLAARHSLTLVAEFSDAVTATGRKARPGFAALLEYLATHPVRAIVARDESRLTREQSPAAQGALMQWLLDHAVTIYTLGGVLDLTDRRDRFRWGLMNLLSADEAAATSERVRAMWQGLQQRGRYVSGRVPYGYRRVPTPGGPHPERYEPDPDQAPVYLELVRRHLAGESYAQLAVWLNQTGVPAQRGGVWTFAAVRAVLRNPVYAGRLVRHWRDEGIEGVAGNVEPLLSPELAEALARRTEVHRAMRAPARSTDRVLAGLLWCGPCEDAGRPARLYGYSSMATPRYRCHRYTEVGDCQAPSVTQRTLLPLILADLRAAWDPEAIAAAQAEADTQGAELATELEAVERQLGRLMELYRDGVVSRAEYDRGAEAPRARQRALEAALASLRPPLPLLSEADLDAVIAAAADPAQQAVLKRLLAESYRRVVVWPDGAGGWRVAGELRY